MTDDDADRAQRIARIELCRRVGYLLVDGPRAIYPPSSIDDFGWLEPGARITLWKYGDQVESVAVFQDDTVNRDSDFLPPLLRHAVWPRAQDFRVRPAWPGVDVRLGKIRDASAIHATLLDLHARLSTLRFAPLGLSTRRDVAEVEFDATLRLNEYSVYAVNGVQTIDYRSRPAVGDPTGREVVRVFGELVAQLEPIETDGWREKYERNPTDAQAGSWWYWDYRRPRRD